MLSNRSRPSSTVIPVLAAEDVLAASAWLCEAFGFEERLRIADHRVQLCAGDGAVILAQGATGTPADSVMVRVEDADAHHARALKQGARILDPPTDRPYGERQYSAEDPAGRRWTFSETIADVAPESWGGTVIR
jgi:uncharacterized glyoxalase superfamily protein PhnB